MERRIVKIKSLHYVDVIIVILFGLVIRFITFEKKKIIRSSLIYIFIYLFIYQLDFYLLLLFLSQVIVHLVLNFYFKILIIKIISHKSIQNKKS